MQRPPSQLDFHWDPDEPDPLSPIPPARKLADIKSLDNSPTIQPPHYISVPIDSIKVPAKLVTMKSVGSLKRSIDRWGLRRPLTVAEGLVLVDGYRRLRACKELGFTEVPVQNPYYYDPPRAKPKRGRPAPKSSG